MKKAPVYGTYKTEDEATQVAIDLFKKGWISKVMLTRELPPNEMPRTINKWVVLARKA